MGMLPVVDEFNGAYGPSVAFSWFHLYEHINQKDAEALKDFLPSLPSFCEMVSSLLNKIENLHEEASQDSSNNDIADLLMQIENATFTLNWLLKGIQFFDVFDPAS